MITSIIQAFLKNQISAKYEQEKKQQRIYDLFHAEIKPNMFSLPYTKQRKFLTGKKSFLRKRRNGELNQKIKEGFLNALTIVIKNDPETSLRKQAYELKVHKKL